jgi:proteasome lid subunit RPN8/RPN11
MKLHLRGEVLRDAAELFEAAGAHGCEATAMVAGRMDGELAHSTRLVVPHQIARTGFGCSVEVTSQGKLDLVAALQKDERYVARIHSHPGEAFHSDVDDDNPGLTAQGAWSIVVPYFGLGLRRGISACAIYVRRGDEWVELSPAEVESQVLVDE